MSSANYMRMKSACWALPATSLISALVMMPVGAQARTYVTKSASEARRFDIQSTDLSESLIAFGDQANVQLVINAAEIRGMPSHPVVGTFVRDEALRRLVGNAPVTIRWIGANTLAVRADRMASRSPTQASSMQIAQESPRSENTGSSGDEIEDIVVTAQHRAENLQDVPIAVTALSASALASRGVQGPAMLETSVPGLTYSTVAANGQPRIRGVGTNLAGAGIEGAVATYVDDVYISSSAAAMLAFNSITQVAVLKGPQGTLFGRNATGGLIQITTRDPSHDFGGMADISYGNLETYGGNFYVTGGLSESLAMDLAAHYENQSKGFGTNLATGKDVHKSRNISLRSKIKAELGPDTTATLAADYENTRSAIPAYRYITSDLPIGGAATLPFPGSTYDVNTDVDPLVKVEQWGTALTVNHQFDFAKLVSVTAYRESRVLARLDGDAGPSGPPFGAAGSATDQGIQISQELRLESKASGPLTWQLGGYVFYGKGGYEPADLNLFGLAVHIETPQKTYSYAAFGQGTYKFDDKTSLTLGVRYTIEKKSLDARGVLAGFAFGPTYNSETVHKPTWRVALDHKLTPSTLVYASYNRGFKSGGYDPGGFVPGGPFFPITYFKPEVLDAFEIGAKNEWFNRRLRLNAAAFYYDYKNMQLNDFANGTTHIYNGKSAKIYGMDMDVTAIPVDNLTLTAGLSLLHSRFGDFEIGYFSVNDAGMLTGPVAGSAEGRKLPNTPAYQVNLGADYHMKLSTGSLDLNVAAFRTGRWYSQPENRLYQKAYNLVNASATWFIDDDQKYSVRFWGKNLGNETYATQLVVQGGLADFAALADGRTYGATLGIKF